METLRSLFAAWAGEPCLECLALGAGGSNRRYYRLLGLTYRCIGAVADDVRENEAFFAYSRHFGEAGLPVPTLFAVHPDRRHYLQQDLGDTTLYSLLLDKRRQGRGFDAAMLALYRQALTGLAAFQLAGRSLDFSVAYPRSDFDRRSILWDLNYFKYFYLKLNHLPFDEELLEDDFSLLADRLLEADCGYFMYRDFQGRNIMAVDSGQWAVGSTRGNELSTTHYPLPTLYFIDYQGGRRGAAQYDVASLLYSASSRLPEVLRTELLNHYLDVRGLAGDERRRWVGHYRLYVLIRLLQTLGAYGYRGLYECKEHFLQSIPPALDNLRLLLQQPDLLEGMPELRRVLERAAAAAVAPTEAPGQGLTVEVLSFSYRRGLPSDPSGNGGGHVFDCRALPNPGRYEQYKAYTGKDRPVVEFLEREAAVARFLEHAQALVAQSVDRYLERRFTHLSVAFGCTGGQHRSVYCAERTAAWLRARYPQVRILLRHREQDR